MINVPHTEPTPAAGVGQRLLRLGCRGVAAPWAWLGFLEGSYTSMSGAHGPGAEALAALANHFASEPRAVGDALAVPALAGCAPVRELGLRGLLGAPIRDWEGRSVGCLVLADHDVRAWSAEDMALLGDMVAVVEEDFAVTRLAEEAIAAQQISEVTHRLAEEGFMVLGPDGVILETNGAAAMLFGYPAFALAGRNVRWLMPAFVAERGESRSVLVGRHRAGHELPIEAVQKAVDPSGQRAIVKLRTASAGRGSASLARELRAPLSAVIGYSECAEAEARAVGHAGLAADVAKIRRASWRMISLVDALSAVEETATSDR